MACVRAVRYCLGSLPPTGLPSNTYAERGCAPARLRQRHAGSARRHSNALSVVCSEAACTAHHAHVAPPPVRRHQSDHGQSGEWQAVACGGMPVFPCAEVDERPRVSASAEAPTSVVKRNRERHVPGRSRSRRGVRVCPVSARPQFQVRPPAFVLPVPVQRTVRQVRSSPRPSFHEQARGVVGLPSEG